MKIRTMVTGTVRQIQAGCRIYIHILNCVGDCAETCIDNIVGCVEKVAEEQKAIQNAGKEMALAMKADAE